MPPALFYYLLSHKLPNLLLHTLGHIATLQINICPLHDFLHGSFHVPAGSQPKVLFNLEQSNLRKFAS